MADVYLERSDLEISRLDVEENTDVEELTDWLKEQDRTASEIAITLAAVKGDPNYHVTGLYRKLALVRVSVMWIQTRLKELGVDDGVVPLSGGLKAHLKAMEQQLQEKNAKIKAQNLEIVALRSELSKLRKAERIAAHEAKATPPMPVGAR